jgi:hypothetical protein
MGTAELQKPQSTAAVPCSKPGFADVCDVVLCQVPMPGEYFSLFYLTTLTSYCILVKFSCENRMMLDVSVQGFCEGYEVSSMIWRFKETVVGQKRQEMRGTGDSMESTRIQAKARLVLLRREIESYIVQRLRLTSHRE